MIFILRMASRELRASWRRLAFFFLCVAVGVGGIVALRSLVQNVRTALAAEARSLTAGDIYIRTEQPWSDEAIGRIEARTAGIEGVARTETIDTITMARLPDGAGTRTKVVEVRGVQAAFPFYGRFALASGAAYSAALLRDDGVLVGRELLPQLGVRVGDAILIGDVEFTIRDAIVAEPGRQLGGFSFGPRVLMAHDALARTGLLAFASRAERQILLKAPDAAIGGLVDALREDLREAFVRVGSYRRTENRIERNLGRAENYLSLIGFVVVILGGIGVWSVTRVFVQQRLPSAAILKCLGATNARVLAVYVTQVALLGLAGALLGVGVAQAALAAVPDALAEQAAAATGFEVVSTRLTASAVAQGIAVGVLVSLLFALVPLLDTRHAKPMLLLRRGDVGPPSGPDWVRMAAIVAVGLGLVAVAAWQAGSIEVGAYVGRADSSPWRRRCICWDARWCRWRGLWNRRAGSPLRHAVAQLEPRPGNQTRVILLAVGLGSFFIIGVQRTASRTCLRRVRGGAPVTTWAGHVPDRHPSTTRRTAYARLLDAAGLGPEGTDPAPRLVPVLRARVTGCDRPVRRSTSTDFEDVRRTRVARSRVRP